MKNIVIAAAAVAISLSAPSAFAAKAKKVGLVGGVVAGAVVGGPVGAVVGGAAGLTAGTIIDDSKTGSVRKHHRRNHTVRTQNN
jgi:hypothetical protein